MPFLMGIPLGSLSEGSVVVEVDLDAPEARGYMGPAWIGPSSQLMRYYDVRNLVVVSAWRIVAVSVFALSLGLFAAWMCEDKIALLSGWASTCF